MLIDQFVRAFKEDVIKCGKPEHVLMLNLFMANIAQTIVLDVANVFEYVVDNLHEMNMNTDEEFIKLFPKTVPPAKYVWMESRNSLYGKYHESIFCESKRVGFISIRFNSTELNETGTLSQWEVKTKETIGWLYYIYIVVMVDNEIIILPLDMALPLDCKGAPMTSSWNTNIDSDLWKSEIDKELVCSVATFLSYQTFTFLHCKNVVTINHEPNSKEQAKRVKKNRLAPLISYKTLEIRPIGRKRSVVTENPISSLKASHIRRGHFKDYTEGKGLFGKLHGIYWWDMALTGSEEAGKIEKVYDIKTE